MSVVQQILVGIPPTSTGSYRYWRIYITEAIAATTYIAFAEIELRGSVGGADLTTTSTPVTESTFLGGSAGSNTVKNDGSTSSWISTTTAVPQWLRYDLGTSNNVAQVAMLPISTVPARAPSIFILQGSNDGTSFTDVKTFTGITSWSAGVWKTFNV